MLGGLLDFLIEALIVVDEEDLKKITGHKDDDGEEDDD